MSSSFFAEPDTTPLGPDIMQNTSTANDTGQNTTSEAIVQLGSAECGTETAGKDSATSNIEHHYDNESSLQQQKGTVSKSKSNVDLQALIPKESLKEAMNRVNLSFGRSSSRHLPDRPVRNHLEHRRTVSTMVFQPVIFEPIARTNSALPEPLVLPPRLRNPAATFEKLPGEIRNRIYRLVLANSASTHSIRDSRMHNMTVVVYRKPFLKSLPGLAYVNRRAYEEVSTILLENTTLEVRSLVDLCYLEDALEHIPGQKGWNSVTRMRFARFSDLAVSPARARELFDFCIRCRNIEQLTLQFKLDQLHMGECSAAHRQMAFIGEFPFVKTVEQVVASYELQMLFELPHLRKVTFVCAWSQNGPIRCTPRTMATFWDLQDWLAHGFAANAANVREVTMSLPFNDPRQMGAWNIRIKRGKQVAG